MLFIKPQLEADLVALNIGLDAANLDIATWEAYLADPSDYLAQSEDLQDTKDANLARIKEIGIEKQILQDKKDLVEKELEEFNRYRYRF